MNETKKGKNFSPILKAKNQNNMLIDTESMDGGGRFEGEHYFSKELK